MVSPARSGPISNNDGCVDGYMREGRYYEGAPMIQPTPAGYRMGERG